MINWHPVQTDFTGGEVSTRMSMRVDTETYQRSLLRMENFMPTPQGTAVRVPGSEFIEDLGEQEDVRLLIFDDQFELQVLAVFLDNVIRCYPAFEPEGPSRSFISATNASNDTEKNIVKNSSFGQRDAYWDYAWEVPSVQEFQPAPEPIEFFGGTGSVLFRLGAEPAVNNLVGSNKFEYVRQQVTVDLPTDVGRLVVTGKYETTFGTEDPTRYPEEFIGMKYIVGTTEGASDVYDSETIWLSNTPDTGGAINVNVDFIMPSVGYTGDLWLEIKSVYGDTSGYDDRAGVHGNFRYFDAFIVASGPPVVNVPSDAIQGDPGDPVTYPVAHVNDLQFVSSPYGDKEVVIVHPEHPPARLYRNINTGDFIIERIKFKIENPDPDGEPVSPAIPDYLPPEWTSGSYPASCGAYQGRLILGGGGKNSEQVICSVSGEWDNLYDIRDTVGRPDPASVFPASAIDFTTTYRSPIRWVAGQKDLFAGCASLEYKVMAQQALLRAGDIDARVQSAHGTTNVQPASIGSEVVFTSERGRILRALRTQPGQTRGEYFSQDLNHNNPDITGSGIRRLVRVRNPHQMVLCVLWDGTAALLSYEPDGDMIAWSLMSTLGNYVDVVIAQDTEFAIDVPVLVVERTIKGQKKHMLEAITEWSDNTQWLYSDSYVNYSNQKPTGVLTGLGHLIGRTVSVVGDGNFIGNYTVTEFLNEDTGLPDGMVELVDGAGGFYEVSLASVGLPKWCELETMPTVFDNQQTGGPGARKRNSSVGVRLRASKIPIINDYRPPTKQADTNFAGGNLPSRLIDLESVEVKQLGYDELATIQIGEVDPVHLELLGIYTTTISSKVG